MARLSKIELRAAINTVADSVEMSAVPEEEVERSEWPCRFADTKNMPPVVSLGIFRPFVSGRNDPSLVGAHIRPDLAADFLVKILASAALASCSRRVLDLEPGAHGPMPGRLRLDKSRAETSLAARRRHRPLSLLKGDCPGLSTMLSGAFFKASMPGDTCAELDTHDQPYCVQAAMVRG